MKYFFTIIGLFFSTVSLSQNITGNWEGSLEIQGNELPIVFHISKDEAGKYSATFDSPKQKTYNNACSDVIVKGDSVILIMQKIKGQYAGKLNDKELTGTWSQSGYTFPLDMKKTGETVTTKKINRPQTPTPPYPYKSEEVIYSNADKSIQFGATFTVPLPDTNVNYFRAPIYPVVLLITGSGPQDRDETIFGHKAFAVIADHLTREGIAVLRVDDRGIGKTTGNFGKSTSADFANDVKAGIDYLKTRLDVDTNDIGLMGHSEGGLIAPMVASTRKDVHFIILLAGPGYKILDMMEQQSADVMASAGINKSDIAQYRPLYKNMVTAVLHAKDSTTASKQAMAIFKKWQRGKSASTVKNTTGVDDEKGIIVFTNAFVNQLSSPWFKYFMQMNPTDYLTKVNCPVLALNGEKDIQVAAKPNLAGIKNALEKNKNSHFTIQEIPGLNHLFQHCKKCTVEEYETLEESFDPATLQLITRWIKTERLK